MDAWYGRRTRTNTKMPNICPPLDGWRTHLLGLARASAPGTCYHTLTLRPTQGKNPNKLQPGARLLAAQHMGMMGSISRRAVTTGTNGETTAMATKQSSLPAAAATAGRCKPHLTRLRSEAPSTRGGAEAVMSDGEVLQSLRGAFERYCSRARQVATAGRSEMDLSGFLRLLRDARLLDNRLTAAHGAAAFNGGRMACSPSEGALEETEEGEFADFEAFLRGLQRAVTMKAAGAGHRISVAGGGRASTGASALAVGHSCCSVNGVGHHDGGAVAAVAAARGPRADPELLAAAHSLVLVLGRGQQREVQPVDALYSQAMMVSEAPHYVCAFLAHSHSKATSKSEKPH